MDVGALAPSPPVCRSELWLQQGGAAEPGTANQLRPSSNSLLPLAEMPSQLSRAEEVEGEWVLEF